MARRDDAPTPISTKPKDKPGQTPSNKLRVYNHKGQHVATVGRLASAATAGRFAQNPKLGRKNGALAWLGSAPTEPSMMQRQAATLRASLRTAKGSVR